MNPAAIFFRYLCRAAASPIVYFTAAISGSTINLFQSGRFLASWVPYIVPLFVQILTRSLTAFANSSSEKLLAISAQRDEASFICDQTGGIIVSTGKTAEPLKKQGIDSLAKFFGREEHLPPSELECLPQEDKELYSPVTECWYRVRVRSSDVGWMVWMEDVSRRRQLDAVLQSIDTFRRYVIRDMETIARKDDIDERTARLILADGWRGVFIAVTSKDGSLEGKVYSGSSTDMRISSPIRVEKDSSAPIWHSRRTEGIVMERREDYADPSEWERTHPLHPDVRDFLGEPYPENFINFHEDDYTLIAFDKARPIPGMEERAAEGLVGTSRTVRSLIGLARAADARFLQAVKGLSAAAEFSDEITGRHIQRVNVYSEILARHLGLDEETCISIGQVAAIHDIGKVAIPHIIKLQRKLSEDERLQMQMHTIFGYQILRQMMDCHPVDEPRLILAAAIALNHHQNFDGSGYPRLIGESGESTPPGSRRWEDYRSMRPLREQEIPKEALIVSLADKYDALRSHRQYKPGFSHRKTLELLEKDDHTGKTAEAVFGPEIWAAFRPIAGEFAAAFDSMPD